MKIAATNMLPGNPQLRHDKKEGRIPPPTPTPPFICVKYVCTVSILYCLGVGEGGAG